MVGYPFTYKRQKESIELSYSVGNPMGAYSSWASFAVAHHFVIFHLCEKLKIDWHTCPYQLLGDDILIGDDRLGEAYITFVNSLGVEVSKPKTYKSPHFVEFAKRLIYDNEEITPFPVSSLNQSMKRSYLIANTLLESEVKGWISGDVPLAVSSAYGIIRKIPSRLKKKFYNDAYVVERIIGIIRGSKPASCLNEIARQFDHPVRLLSEDECQGILSNIAVQLFAESNPENKKGGKPLGDIAIFYTCLFTDPNF